MESTVVEFGAEEFIGLAGGYAADNKVKRVVDALCGAKSDREDVLSAALEIIGQLELMSDNGQSYTPGAHLGFGSDNAATIADKILGRSTSAGEVRKSFAKIGKV